MLKTSPLRAAALSLVTLLVVALASTATAAVQSSEDDGIRLVISRLSGVTGPGSVPTGAEVPTEALIRVLVEHRGRNAMTDAEVVVETFDRSTTRSGLQVALDLQQVTGPRHVERLPVREGTVEPGDVAAVDVFLPVSRVVQSGRSGVYPVQFTLVRGTTVVDRVVTAVVHLSEPPQNPLQTVAVWPVDSAPWTTPHASRSAFDAEIAPGGRLDALVRGLEAVPTSGLVPAVSAHLLDALTRRTVPIPAAPTDARPPDATDAPAVPAGAASPAPASSDGSDAQDPGAAHATDLLARLRAVLATLRHPPVAGPYASADLDALVDAGPQMIGIAGELAADGPRRVEGLAGRAPDPVALLPRVPLSTRSLDLLPGDHLLLSYGDVLGPDLEVVPDLPHPVQRLRATSGRVFTVEVADPHVADALAAPHLEHGVGVAVQRIVAETALLHFEQPGVPDRPLLVLPPRDWDPGVRFSVDLARALTNAPWIALSDAAAASRVPVGDLEEGTLAVITTHLPTEHARSVGTTLSSVAAVAAALADARPTIAGRTVADLDDQLRRATSSWFATTPEIALDMVSDVDAAVDAAYGTVEVPTADAITLLSEQGKIPITLRRTTGDPIEIEVEVRSRGALTWPSGSVQRRTLTAGGTQTLSFDVLARTRGDIPVEVIVRDATGARVLADATIRVRSTFVSRPALVTTAVVVALLLLVSRLRRRPPADDEPDGADTGDGDEGSVLTVLPGGER